MCCYNTVINTREENRSCVFHAGGRIANIRVTMHREKGLNAGVTSHCTESTKSIHGTALYQQCNLPATRRTTFFPFSSSFSFFAFFAASIYSSRRHLTPSWDRPHLVHASTYKNFICLAHAIISMLVYYIFLLEYALFFFFFTNSYSNVLY